MIIQQADVVNRLVVTKTGRAEQPRDDILEEITQIRNDYLAEGGSDPSMSSARLFPAPHTPGVLAQIQTMEVNAKLTLAQAKMKV